MKKNYNKPAIDYSQMVSSHLLTISVEHRGWAIDGTFNEDEELHDENMGSSDHDATYNLWQQELDDDDWADLD